MAAMINQWKSCLDKQLREKNKFTDALAFVESKTKVDRLYVFLGLVALVSTYLMIGCCANFVCNFIGFLYPAYLSIKAIESHNKDDDTLWLTYWVVYSTFALVEFFADMLLFWIPLYWFLKCVFLIWCMVPGAHNGSQMIYHRAIKPFFLRHQGKIDTAINKAAGVAGEVVDGVKQRGKEE